MRNLNDALERNKRNIAGFARSGLIPDLPSTAVRRPEKREAVLALELKIIAEKAGSRQFRRVTKEEAKRICPFVSPKN